MHIAIYTEHKHTCMLDNCTYLFQLAMLIRPTCRLTGMMVGELCTQMWILNKNKTLYHATNEVIIYEISYYQNLVCLFFSPMP